MDTISAIKSVSTIPEEQIYAANTIAHWFINKAAEQASNGGEYITHLKLQKLLYYAQGCYGAINQRKLFEEEIYNWAHGPVVKEIYQEYKEYGDQGIDRVEDVEIDAETEGLLEEVFQVFGRYSAWTLREMTHQEDPWKNTTRDQIIPFESICKYFKAEIVTE